MSDEVAGSGLRGSPRAGVTPHTRQSTPRLMTRTQFPRNTQLDQLDDRVFSSDLPDDIAAHKHDLGAMSSPQSSFLGASPAAAGARRRSQFTYRNLNQMATYITSCPLRVVTHIDLDCFYAQAEMVRLGVPEDQPLAVQQWYAMASCCCSGYPSPNVTQRTC